MYFVKARKNLEDQDARDSQEKGRRDRYQRSDSARLVVQAMPTATQQPKQAEGKSQFYRSDSGAYASGLVASGVDSSNFRPEELPDGACYRPKKDLTNLPGAASESQSRDIRNSTTGLMEHIRPVEYIGTFSVSGSDKEVRERQMESQLEHMRNAQERRPVQLVISAAGVKVILPENNNVFMEHSLKRIWYATCDPEYHQFSFLAREPKTSAEVQYCHAFVTQTPEQAEELIALIGEAFKSTYTEQQQNGKDPKEQEQPKKQPTFHEIIEQQVLQQQAKFREIEQEAQSALQQTLNQIATPTPFSERAQSRMEERRRQSEDLTLANFSAAAARRDWAKHEIQRVKHSPERSNNNSNSNSNHHSNSNNSPASNPNRRSEIPTRQSTPKTSPFKRNSVPPQVSLSSSQPHPLSALAIKESMESKAASKGSKFKGSPVTALKNEIDRRLAMSNGEEPPPPPPPSLVPVEQQPSKQQQQHATLMANRPLPLPPADECRSPRRSRHQSPHGQGQVTPSPSTRDLPPTPAQVTQRRQQPHPMMQYQRSLDDYHLPRSSTSPQMVGSSRPPSGVAAPASGNHGNPAVRLRDSPRRRQPRPMSEIATSSSGHGGARPGGSSYYEQQRQSLLSNFAASFNLQPHAEGDQQVGSLRADGMFIYGPGPAPAPREAEAYSLATANVDTTFGGGGGGDRGGKRRSWAQEEAVNVSPSRQQLYLQQQQQQQHQQQQQQLQQQQQSPFTHHQNGKVPTNNGIREPSPSSSSSSSPALTGHPNQTVTSSRVHSSPQHHSAQHHLPPSSSTSQETQVLRYQNDSQFVSPSAASKQGPGLASLMCLDRSHILDETLRHAVWYQANLPREIALEILQQEEVGAFVVRDSSTHPGCYALSVRVPRFENASGISHYLILRTQRGVKLKGLDKEWSTLAALVTHHTVMREMLPCTLRLPKVKASATSAQNATPSGSPKHAPSSVSPPPSSATRAPQDARYTRTKTVTRTFVNGNDCKASVSQTTTAVCSSREQFHMVSGSGGGGVVAPPMGVVREREAGVMHTDNYSYLSEMSDFVDQLKM